MPGVLCPVQLSAPCSMRAVDGRGVPYRTAPCLARVPVFRVPHDSARGGPDHGLAFVDDVTGPRTLPTVSAAAMASTALSSLSSDGPYRTGVGHVAALSAPSGVADRSVVRPLR